MKLLVFSDSHGKLTPMFSAVEREKPDAVIHLGDYVRDVDALRERFPALTVYSVRGNCDHGSEVTELLELTLEGVPVFLCHGHCYGVKYGTEKLLNAGWFSGARLVLFGHTHRPLLQEYEELTLLNPGSAASSAARVELTGDGEFTAELMEI